MMACGKWLNYARCLRVSAAIVQVESASVVDRSICTTWAEFADPPPRQSTSSEEQQPHSIPPVPPSDVPEPTTLREYAVLILNTPNPELKVNLNPLFVYTFLFTSSLLLHSSKKVERTRQAVSAFRTGKITSTGRSRTLRVPPPDIPPREQLEIVQPGKVTKRGKGGSVKSRIAILHALANIEQWA
jgi:hypothetical protein